MRFMVMHKVDARMEAGERPPQALIEQMQRLIGKSIKAGIFLDGAGLHRSASRVRLELGAGKPTVVHGPYAGSNELLSGFAMVKATSTDHAIQLATQLATAAGEREIEIGPVVEPWDLSGGRRPPDAPFRFLLVRKANDQFESGAAQPAAVQEVLDAWKREGTLVSAARLAPSSQGARSRVVAGQRTWTDGPFAEAKELIAGFSILELPSLEVVKTFTDEYAAILGDNEVDIRVVAGD